MTERTPSEREAITRFLSDYFPREYIDEKSISQQTEPDDSTISDEELAVIEQLIAAEQSEFVSSKGTLGLGIDFLMIAEQLSQTDEWVSGFDPDVSADDILSRYDQASVKSTLTITHDGEKYAIRPVQNAVIDLFREDLKRTNFPSSPGHHTGEWERYTDLLAMAFQLSRDGRYIATQRLFEYGLEQLERKDITQREPPFPSPFEAVLHEYDRSHPDEEGGLTYQAWAYGYVTAMWPHLSLEASKVRTGSSRQNRYGDIDGYQGPDLMLSVEVKDRAIDGQNVESELGSIMVLAENATTIVVAVCRSASDDAITVLREADVNVLTDEQLAQRLQLWDYHKQNRALQAMAHYLTNIEEDPGALQRLLRFIEHIDPNNTALAHLIE